MKELTYKSKDGYFDIIERLEGDIVLVKHIFSTPIFNSYTFYTITAFNSEGKLIRYDNALGDSIDYSSKPITVRTLPKLFKDIL